MATFTIGQVAQRVSIRTSTLRYYEEIGLLPPPKRISGRRQYDDQIFQQVAGIQLAKQAGFSLAEIRTLIQDTNPTPYATNWEQLARRKLQELDDLIANAQQMKAHLEESLTCYCQQLADCEFVEAKVSEYLEPTPQ